jgi:formyltetrahydrofolate deformylase
MTEPRRATRNRRSLVNRTMPPHSYVLTIICPDRPGIVHAVTGFLVEHGGNILELQQFEDLDENRFFMRVLFVAPPPASLEQLRTAFGARAAEFSMRWELWEAAAPYRTLILVSKFSHCLNDLLFRWRNGDLQIDVAGVVSNHPDCAPLAASYDVDFHHLPVTPDTKAQAEAELLTLVDELDVDLVVLARYMQILTPKFVGAYPDRIINIHHSFLPAFAGADPYRRAHDRGVKTIGATAHYVTEELDAGPIIHQDVAHVTHRDTVEDLVRLGREIERRVLARAVRWHLEDRILVDGNRTIVFE